MNDIIQIEGLVKTLGTTAALDGLNLHVKRGSVHGLLGPNGAGKTTTLRILLGLLRKDLGEVQVLGGDPYRDAVDLHRKIAYVPGDVQLWPALTGGQTIDVLTSLRGGASRERIGALAEAFQLELGKKARAYSKGNRQKVALIAALATEAELYLFDEPTTGLDPLMEAVFQSEVRRLAEAGATVLLSSHILAQVEALADRITIVRSGREVETGTLAELRHLRRTSFQVETDADSALIAALPGVYGLNERGGGVEFEVDGDQVGAVISALAELHITAIRAQPASLEQLLLRHYGLSESER